MLIFQLMLLVTSTLTLGIKVALNHTYALLSGFLAADFMMLLHHISSGFNM